MKSAQDAIGAKAEDIVKNGPENLKHYAKAFVPGMEDEYMKGERDANINKSRTDEQTLVDVLKKEAVAAVEKSAHEINERFNNAVSDDMILRMKEDAVAAIT